MRHCTGDDIEVYESKGPHLPDLLEDVARSLREKDYLFANLTVCISPDDGEYLVTVYIHDEGVFE